MMEQNNLIDIKDQKTESIIKEGSFKVTSPTITYLSAKQVEQTVRLSSNDFLEIDPDSPPTNEPYIRIGFDTEYWDRDLVLSLQDIRTNKQHKMVYNQVLSYQYAVDTNYDDTKIKGIIYPKKDERYSIQQFIQIVLGEMVKNGAKNIPYTIYLVGYFTKADIPSFENFKDIKNYVDAIRSSFVNIKRHKGAITISLPTVEKETYDIDIMIRDCMLLTPNQRGGLAVLGDMVGLEKIRLADNLQEEKSIKSNMNKLLKNDIDLFERYAIRDAEVCLKYIDDIQSYYTNETGKINVPLTLTQIGVDLLEKFWVDDSGDKDYRLKVIGKEKIKKTYYNKKTGKRTGYYKEEPYGIAYYFIDFVTESYHGGRNEQFWFGPSFEDDWNDFDLSSAYPIAMSCIGLPDWHKVKTYTDLSQVPNLHQRANAIGERSLWHPLELSYWEIDFEFPDHIRYPCLPVRTDHGVIFPRRGKSNCSSPELYLAIRLGCHITKLHMGIHLESDTAIRPFEKFIRYGVKRRNEAKQKQSPLEDQFWKEVVNSTYGKTAQGLREKRQYDLRSGNMKQLAESRITNPYFASYITSFVRATLAEMMNSIPDDRLVFSVTTDGFLTNTTDTEMKKCTTGRLCQLFAEQAKVIGKTEFLAKKHKVRRSLGWRTRGQATLEQTKLTKQEIKQDVSDVLLAKAGIHTSAHLETLEEQNEEIVDMFFNRHNESLVRSSRGVGLKDLVLNNTDYMFFFYEKRLNMEYDWKRKPVAICNSAKYNHLSFNTEPWRTVEEFHDVRDYWEHYSLKKNKVLNEKKNMYEIIKTQRNLKTVEDIESFLFYLNDRLDKQGVRRYVPHVDGDIKRLRIELCSAFKHNPITCGMKVGNTVEYTDEQFESMVYYMELHDKGKYKIKDKEQYRIKITEKRFAKLLSAQGIPCKAKDVNNAKNRPFFPNRIPPTKRIEKLLKKVQENLFPDLQYDRFFRKDIDTEVVPISIKPDGDRFTRLVT